MDTHPALQAWMMYNLVSAACLVLFVIPKGAASQLNQGQNSSS